jgi:hypothetical protein
LELNPIQVNSHEFVSVEADIVTVEDIPEESYLHFNPPITDLQGPLLIQLPTPIVSLWRDNAWYQSLIVDSRTPFLCTPLYFFTASTMDQLTYTTSILGSTETQTLPFTIGGTFVHNGSSISYDFGGPSIPPGYQSLNETFSGASTNASIFHYPPWSTGMPSLSSMSIPSMVHTSQTNVVP